MHLVILLIFVWTQCKFFEETDCCVYKLHKSPEKPQLCVIPPFASLEISSKDKIISYEDVNVKLFSLPDYATNSIEQYDNFNFSLSKKNPISNIRPLVLYRLETENTKSKAYLHVFYRSIFGVPLGLIASISFALTLLNLSFVRSLLQKVIHRSVSSVISRFFLPFVVGTGLFYLSTPSSIELLSELMHVPEEILSASLSFYSTAYRPGKRLELFLQSHPSLTKDSLIAKFFSVYDFVKERIMSLAGWLLSIVLHPLHFITSVIRESALLFRCAFFDTTHLFSESPSASELDSSSSASRTSSSSFVASSSFSFPLSCAFFLLFMGTFFDPHSSTSSLSASLVLFPLLTLSQLFLFTNSIYALFYYPLRFLSFANNFNPSSASTLSKLSKPQLSVLPDGKTQNQSTSYFSFASLLFSQVSYDTALKYSAVASVCSFCALYFYLRHLTSLKFHSYSMTKLHKSRFMHRRRHSRPRTEKPSTLPYALCSFLLIFVFIFHIGMFMHLISRRTFYFSSTSGNMLLRQVRRFLFGKPMCEPVSMLDSQCVQVAEPSKEEEERLQRKMALIVAFVLAFDWSEPKMKKKKNMSTAEEDAEAEEEKKKRKRKIAKIKMQKLVGRSKEQRKREAKQMKNKNKNKNKKKYGQKFYERRKEEREEESSEEESSGNEVASNEISEEELDELLDEYEDDLVSSSTLSDSDYSVSDSFEQLFSQSSYHTGGRGKHDYDSFDSEEYSYDDSEEYHRHKQRQNYNSKHNHNHHHRSTSQFNSTSGDANNEYMRDRMERAGRRKIADLTSFRSDVVFTLTRLLLLLWIMSIICMAPRNSEKIERTLKNASGRESSVLLSSWISGVKDRQKGEICSKDTNNASGDKIEEGGYDDDDDDDDDNCEGVQMVRREEYFSWKPVFFEVLGKGRLFLFQSLFGIHSTANNDSLLFSASEAASKAVSQEIKAEGSKPQQVLLISIPSVILCLLLFISLCSSPFSPNSGNSLSLRQSFSRLFGSISSAFYNSFIDSDDFSSFSLSYRRKRKGCCKCCRCGCGCNCMRTFVNVISFAISLVLLPFNVLSIIVTHLISPLVSKISIFILVVSFIVTPYFPFFSLSPIYSNQFTSSSSPFSTLKSTFQDDSFTSLSSFSSACATFVTTLVNIVCNALVIQIPLPKQKFELASTINQVWSSASASASANATVLNDNNNNNNNGSSSLGAKVNASTISYIVSNATSSIFYIWSAITSLFSYRSFITRYHSPSYFLSTLSAVPLSTLLELALAFVSVLYAESSSNAFLQLKRKMERKMRKKQLISMLMERLRRKERMSDNKKSDSYSKRRKRTPKRGIEAAESGRIEQKMLRLSANPLFAFLFRAISSAFCGLVILRMNGWDSSSILIEASAGHTHSLPSHFYSSSYSKTIFRQHPYISLFIAGVATQCFLTVFISTFRFLSDFLSALFVCFRVGEDGEHALEHSLRKSERDKRRLLEISELRKDLKREDEKRKKKKQNDRRMREHSFSDDEYDTCDTEYYDYQNAAFTLNRGMVPQVEEVVQPSANFYSASTPNSFRSSMMQNPYYEEEDDRMRNAMPHRRSVSMSSVVLRENEDSSPAIDRRTREEIGQRGNRSNRNSRSNSSEAKPGGIKGIFQSLRRSMTPKAARDEDSNEDSAQFTSTHLSGSINNIGGGAADDELSSQRSRDNASAAYMPSIQLHPFGAYPSSFETYEIPQCPPSPYPPTHLQYASKSPHVYTRPPSASASPAPATIFHTLSSSSPYPPRMYPNLPPAYYPDPAVAAPSSSAQYVLPTDPSGVGYVNPSFYARSSPSPRFPSLSSSPFPTQHMRLNTPGLSNSPFAQIPNDSARILESSGMMDIEEESNSSNDHSNSIFEQVP